MVAWALKSIMRSDEHSSLHCRSFHFVIDIFRIHLESGIAILTRVNTGCLYDILSYLFYDMLASMFAVYMLLIGSFTSLLQFGIQAPAKVCSEVAFYDMLPYILAA